MPMTWIRRVTLASMPVGCCYPEDAVHGVVPKRRGALTLGHNVDEREKSTMTSHSREEFSERLLKGSVKMSDGPVVVMDWVAPLDPDKFFLPPKTVSLYG